jgi:hypothetical protein
MRFMMLMMLDGETAYGGTGMPTAEQVAAMSAFNKEMQEAGIVLAMDGLQSPAVGARVSFATGSPSVTDGPFAETKEVFGGFWMIDVPSKADAIAWASRCPGSPNETIEIRQVFEMTDFPEEIQKAAGYGQS